MTGIQRMNAPALALAVTGPLAGVAVWYGIDRTLGQPALALAVGAAMIYIASRAVGDLAVGRDLFDRFGDRLLILAIVMVPYWALVIVGVPALVSLLISIVLAPPFFRPVTRVPTSDGDWLRSSEMGTGRGSLAPRVAADREARP